MDEVDYQLESELMELTREIRNLKEAELLRMILPIIREFIRQ